MNQVPLHIFQPIFSFFAKPKLLYSSYLQALVFSSIFIRFFMLFLVPPNCTPLLQDVPPNFKSQDTNMFSAFILSSCVNLRKLTHHFHFVLLLHIHILPTKA